jgi:plasmid stabilization system protein ParE
MNWQASPETDEDLIAARDFIAVDNQSAAKSFLDTVFEAIDRLAQFPEMGPQARFKRRDLHGVRYFVLAPPFNRWLVFLSAS